MELLHQAVDLFLHLDRHLSELIQNYGLWTYAILFVIIFCETGLVVTPFLPGDSLLFAVGAFAGKGDLNPWIAMGLLIAAAVLGDTVNYWIGFLFGPKLAAKYPRLIKKKHLEKTHAFYEKYGPETIILCRFVPIVRTFAPFVAGFGTMTYRKFIAYNILGGVIWVALLMWGGYWFGRLEFVQKHFGAVELAIIVISVLPMVVEYLRYRRDAAKEQARP
jgi:membrane-associated protein